MPTIFVSSTFQDMQAERDILRDQVLARIKMDAKKYGQSLELCDLRWGVNSFGLNESESAMKVLQVCFNAIDKAKPYFIVLLGNRYGWIPPQEIVQDLLSSMHIVKSEFVGKSVTEMEILYGAFLSDKTENVRFYFREADSPVDANLHDAASEDNERHIEALKAKIRERFPDKVRTYSAVWNPVLQTYTDLEPFVEMVYQDLKEIIDLQFKSEVHNSEFDHQYYQYQYAATDHIYMDQNAFLNLLRTLHRQPEGLMLEKFKKPLCILVMKNEYVLNQLFGSLYRQWHEESHSFPYCCNQSVSASSVRNLLNYFITMLSHAFHITVEKNVEGQNELTKLKAEFTAVLDAADHVAEKPIVLAIRGIQYLDDMDFFKWFPVKKYHNIRILISSDVSRPSPSGSKELMEEIFFPNQDILNSKIFIDSYIYYFHKEMDDNVFEAIRRKTEKTDNIYREMLMQRLLLLSKEDFDCIRQNGDGMKAISDYLVQVVENAPNSTRDMIREQLRRLEAETDSCFLWSTLAILSVLPYGIPKRELETLLLQHHVPYTPLYLVLLTRYLSFSITETLDNFYRMNENSLIISLISDDEIQKWTAALDAYFEKIECGELNAEDWNSEFYRSNRLFIAVRHGNSHVLPAYLTRTGHQARDFAVILHALICRIKIADWLQNSVANLSDEDIQWLTEELYPYISQEKLYFKSDNARILLSFWKCLIPLTEERASVRSEQQLNCNWFRANFQAGELAYRLGENCAEEYLFQAKRIAKLDFQMFPNRIWKKLHEIPLTEAELKMGHDAIPDADDSMMFGFYSEIEDMHFQQSWSYTVRIINNYLSEIYRQKGEKEKAHLLMQESMTLTHISDPDPLEQGIHEIVPGITIFYPDEEEPQKRHPYAPDYRRNSAIQLCSAGYKEAALAKFRASNEILKQIYADGETCTYYDMKNVMGDIQEACRRIRMECTRDLGINYRGMLNCFKFSEENTELLEAVEEMIKWSLLYDSYKNNVQSKIDLEEWYLISAGIYLKFRDVKRYSDRILRDVKKYFEYRIEAHKMGEHMNEHIANQRHQAFSILFELVNVCPECGDEITNILLEYSNGNVIANDFDSSLELTKFMETLLIWMWEHSLHWTGRMCSMEYIYCFNMDNQSMLWEKYGHKKNLKIWAERSAQTIKFLKEAQNVQAAASCIMRYVFALVQDGEFVTAAGLADSIVAAFRRVDMEAEILHIVDIENNILAIYSEAGRISDAIRMGFLLNRYIRKLEEDGYSNDMALNNITRFQFNKYIVTQQIKLNMNLAIAYNRNGEKNQGEKHLQYALTIANHHQEAVRSETELLSHLIHLYRYGLPD